MKILSSLSSDASESGPRLARELGMPVSVVYSRIKRLQKRGVIERFTITVDENKLGMGSSAVVGVRFDPKQREQAIEEVARLEFVRELREVTGRFDAFLGLRSASVEELHRAVREGVGKVPGVTDIEVFVEVSKKSPHVQYKISE